MNPTCQPGIAIALSVDADDKLSRSNPSGVACMNHLFAHPRLGADPEVSALGINSAPTTCASAAPQRRTPGRERGVRRADVDGRRTGAPGFNAGAAAGVRHALPEGRDGVSGWLKWPCERSAPGTLTCASLWPWRCGRLATGLLSGCLAAFRVAASGRRFHGTVRR